MKILCNQSPSNHIFLIMLVRTFYSACFREQLGCKPAKNVVDSPAVPDSWVIKFASCAVIWLKSHTAQTDHEFCWLQPRRIGPRGFLAPLGVVTQHLYFVWVVVRFPLSCEIQQAAGNKLGLMLTLLSGGQRRRTSSCSKDWDYKLQVVTTVFMYMTHSKL